jgi:glycosyltransferase involved in cell wall biosynthesis
MAEKRKIIILTPVKNESWILDRFLQVCSRFADHIIIADQSSTDGSLDIYSNYSKVTLIENTEAEFNEANRQLLLLKTAREKFGIGNILLAIDADEILAADAMHSGDWNRMLFAKPGTILFFEKPTFYKSTSNVIRYDGGGWPLGYVDDGAAHVPSQIHSTRIPTPKNSEKLYLHAIKFLHYALIRLDAQASKQRMYSMLENIRETRSLRHRLRMYNSKMDFSKEGDRHESSDLLWFSGWEEQGIDMHTIPTAHYYWYDYEGLKLLQRYGVSKFCFDDIWDFDWEALRLEAVEKNYIDSFLGPIKAPHPVMRKLLKEVLQQIDGGLKQIKTLRGSD